MAVAVFVQINRLENVLVKRHVGRELALVIRAVEAHFELGAVLRVHFDVVHWFERFLGHFVAHGLVDGRELGYGLVWVVEVFVVLAHIVAVPVGDGDVVGEFGGPEHFVFAEGCGAGEDAFGGVGAGRGVSVCWS